MFFRTVLWHICIALSDSEAVHYLTHVLREGETYTDGGSVLIKETGGSDKFPCILILQL